MDAPTLTETIRIICENCPDVIYIMNFDERFSYISPSVESIMGYTPAEVIGKKIQNFLTPQSYEKQKVGMLKVIREKRFDVSEVLVLRVFRKDGRKIWMEAHAKFIKDEKGYPKAILGVAREVTDRVDAEEELKKKIEQLENLSK